jgi:hypothetical protein
MEDSSVFVKTEVNATDSRMPLGMSSFSSKNRHQFGQNLRLAMACIEGSLDSLEPVDYSKTIPSDELVKPAVSTQGMPSGEVAIGQRLRVLCQDMSSNYADLLELLVRFDDLQGYKASGASYCAAWMNLELGISLKLGWEYLRVGRKLRSLPTTTALFRAGKLSWSKVRVLVNVADKVNEKTLCHAALDASVSDVVRLCDGYRWQEDDSGEVEYGDGENERALRQWESRSLTWSQASNGSTRIQLMLPPELAQAFLNSVEHSLHQLTENAPSEPASTENTFAQRRADAALLMAESSLQSSGRDFASADRYQVIVSVDATELVESTANSTLEKHRKLPSKRPTVKGAGSVARETARRIACDCCVTTNTIVNGEPTDIGRKSRLWPAAMARAIKDRDQHCQFHGCTQTYNLQIHHIKHWADGGTTSVTNGVCLCQYHHTQVHEGGYTIQPVDSNEQYLNAQFADQQRATDGSLFEVEKELRNDRDSFNTVRRLLPTRYRFRIVDSQGLDIRQLGFSQAASHDISSLSRTEQLISAQTSSALSAAKHSISEPSFPEYVAQKSFISVNSTNKAAQQKCLKQVDSLHTDSTFLDATRMESTCMDSTRMDSTRVDSKCMEPTCMNSTRMDSKCMEPTCMDSTGMDSTGMAHTGEHARYAYNKLRGRPTVRLNAYGLFT